MAVKIHLLDVGTQKYGDSVLCEFGATTVLIDGAHSGDTEIIRDQINELLDQPKISLLIVTHAHADHIGCIPKLVADGSIAVEWALVPDPDLGFGKTPGDAPPDSETDAQRRTRILAAALREEDRTDVPDADLREFLDSLDNQEADYRKFIQDLRDGGANVVLFGTKSINQIQQQFNAIGFRVVGPNQAQIDAAAERIKNAVDFTDAIAADVLSRDAQADLVDTYRALMSAVTDSGRDRPGDAINMMSLVTRFTVGGRKFLFGGDMEFAHPKPSIDAIEQGVAAMRQAIRDDAPYDFYKLCHHGSWNGFDGDILADLGATKYLGICTGTNSPSHPAAKTLTLLRQNDDDLKWARTDRNGRSTFSFGTNVRVTKERGKLNNSEPNKQDVFGGEEQPLIPAPPPPVTVTTAPVLSGGDPVEVIARVRSGTRVTITIDVDGDGRSDVSTSRGEAVRNTGVPRIEIGRDVERLLFVTSAAALADNIGPAAGLALNALRKRGAIVLDTLPAGLQHASQAAPVVQEELRRSQAKGVVILGGYDVVPPQSLDCLPPELRRRTARNADPDNFIVWSDDTYGDREGDHFPEVPVSRIPDGRSAALVAASLAAPPRGVGSAAVRNVARPFAEVVYSRLPGGRPILRSEATIFSAPRYLLDSANVYVMLHGDYTDGSRFWGEDTEDDLEALNISNLPAVSGAVVFTGCCWGALTVDKPAGRLVPGQTLGVKTPDSSIALAFLRRGARAYVGCTGAHYSPLEDPYDFFGGPMHEAFWGEIVRGVEPAQALFNAKATYMRGLPHGQTSVAGRSIEYKIARQFTCLGLGW